VLRPRIGMPSHALFHSRLIRSPTDIDVLVGFRIQTAAEQEMQRCGGLIRSLMVVRLYLIRESNFDETERRSAESGAGH